MSGGAYVQGMVDDPQRSKALYDGVLGELPEWVPENFRREFRVTRDNLLLFYSHDDLLAYMAHLRHFWEHQWQVNPYPQAPGEIHREIVSLVHFQEAVRLGKEDGLALLTDPGHAKRLKMGEAYSEQQSERASKPRGKVSDDGETIGGIIGRLALSPECEDLRAKELWPLLFAELDELVLNPEEAEDCYIYDLNGKRKSQSFGQFAKVVSKHRAKKKLP